MRTNSAILTETKEQCSNFAKVRSAQLKTGYAEKQDRTYGCECGWAGAVEQGANGSCLDILVEEASRIVLHMAMINA